MPPNRLNQMTILQLRDTFIAARVSPGDITNPAKELPEEAYRFACGTFTLLLQLSPALRELTVHGTRSFHQTLLKIEVRGRYRDTVKVTEAGITSSFLTDPQTTGNLRAGSARAVLLQKSMWKSLMDRLNAMETSGSHAVHPKLVALGGILEDHFKRKAVAGVPARAIVFTETRGR